MNYFQQLCKETLKDSSWINLCFIQNANVPYLQFHDLSVSLSRIIFFFEFSSQSLHVQRVEITSQHVFQLYIWHSKSTYSITAYARVYDSHNPLFFFFLPESGNHDVKNIDQHSVCLFTDINRQSIIITSMCIKKDFKWIVFICFCGYVICLCVTLFTCIYLFLFNY